MGGENDGIIEWKGLDDTGIGMGELVRE